MHGSGENRSLGAIGHEAVHLLSLQTVLQASGIKTRTKSVQTDHPRLGSRAWAAQTRRRSRLERLGGKEATPEEARIARLSRPGGVTEPGVVPLRSARSARSCWTEELRDER